MADKGPLLDEISWRDAHFAAQHGIHENTVLHYFAQSPFFDAVSNNAFIVNQATFNANMAHLIATRSAMEGRLKTMSGLEFMIAQEPAEMGPGTGTGVWVIRKQTRKKRPPEEDEISVLATYYIVGENIYMAPTIGDILGNRMLSILTSLQSLATTAIHASRSDPWLNADYAKPLSDDPESPPSRPLDRSSKDPTPTPEFPSFTTTDGNVTSSSPPNTSRRVPSLLSKTSSNLVSNSLSSSFLLDETFSIALKYGDEYMDEHPITGGPGDFHLSSSSKEKALEKGVARVDWEALMKEQSQADANSPLGTKVDVGGSPGKKTGRSPKTSSSFTGLAGAGFSTTSSAGGGSGMPRIKRKKSKVPGTPVS